MDLTVKVTVSENQDNDTKEVQFELTDPLPPFVSPLDRMVVSGHSIALPGSSTGAQVYNVTFSLLEDPTYFFVPPFVLWVAPPGSKDLKGDILFGNAATTASGSQPKTCNLTVTINPAAPFDEFDFFLSIGRAVEGLGILRLVFLADPTIVTDPDPG